MPSGSLPETSGVLPRGLRTARSSVAICNPCPLHALPLPPPFQTDQLTPLECKAHSTATLCGPTDGSGAKWGCSWVSRQGRPSPAERVGLRATLPSSRPYFVDLPAPRCDCFAAVVERRPPPRLADCIAPPRPATPVASSRAAPAEEARRRRCLRQGHLAKLLSELVS